MALPTGMIFEVRAAGHADNGAGFAYNGTGADRTQSASPHVIFDGGGITASTAGVSAVLTLSGYTVDAADKDNVVKITGGANFTTGSYHITAVNAGANTWTLDRNCCTAAASGMTGRMGGASDKPSTVLNIGSTLPLRPLIWVGAGTYVENSQLVMAQDRMVRMWGYSSTRGDGGRPTVQRTSGTNTMLAGTGAGYSGCDVRNFLFDCNSLAAYGCGFNEYQNVYLENVDVLAYTNTGYLLVPKGMNTGGTHVAKNCRARNGTAASSYGFDLRNGGFALGCLVRNFYGRAYWFGNGNQGGLAEDCIAAVGNGTSYGFYSGGPASIPTSFIRNCVAYSCTHGIYLYPAYEIGILCEGNILHTCTTGINMASTDPAYLCGRGNAFYNCPTNKSALIQANAGDVLLTADPFTNLASDDWSLNSVAGGGTAVKVLLETWWTGSRYRDYGAMQSQGSGGGGLRRSDFSGGFNG